MMSDNNCNGCKYSKKLKYSSWPYCSCNKCEVEVRADERKKAEQDFQNSEYWNEYLAKVIADAREESYGNGFNDGMAKGSIGNDEEDIRADEREKLLKEICECERTMIDDDGKIHFVVKTVDIMKVFNKEQKK